MGKRDAAGQQPEKPDPTGRGEAWVRRQRVIDALLADALRPVSVIEVGDPSLAADILRAIDLLLAKAATQRSRCLTYEDLEEALPPRDVSPEDLEAIFWILAEHGIEVEDGEP